MVYMLLTPHAAVGIAIGSAIPDPKIAIPLAFLSHFVLDAIPHWDDIGIGFSSKRFSRISRPAFRFVLVDFLLALSLTLFFVYWALPDVGVAAIISACALAAILADAYYIPLAFFGKRWGPVMWVVKLQSRMQQSSKAPRAFGLLIQGVLITLCLLVAHQQILVLLPQIWKIP